MVDILNADNDEEVSTVPVAAIRPGDIVLAQRAGTGDDQHGALTMKVLSIPIPD
jgi:hypothetical protein